MKISELNIPLAVSAKAALRNKQTSQTPTQNTKDTQAQGTVGTQGTNANTNQNTNQQTIGKTQSTNTQNKSFMRGQEVEVPNADNPGAPEKYVVSAVQGNEVELKPKMNKPNLPKSIKFNKQDLA